MAVHWGGRGPGHMSRRSAAQSSSPPAPSFDPATLFAAAQPGVWYDVQDLATMWQDTAGTIPAAVGSAVARIDDKSGNARNATQGTGSLQPILRDDGFRKYLELDTADDRLSFTFSGMTADSDVAMACRRTSAASQILAKSLGTLGVAESGSGSAATGGAGSPAYLVDGVAVPGGTAATRAQLYTAWSIDVNTLVEADGAGLNTWNVATTLPKASTCGVSRIYGFLARAGGFSADERADVQQYYAQILGITI